MPPGSRAAARRAALRPARRSAAAPRSARRTPRSCAHHVAHDDPGRRYRSADEAEERPEVTRGGKAGDVEAGHAGTEGGVEVREAVVGRDARQVRDTGDVGAVAAREHDPVGVQVDTGGERDLAIVGRDHLGAGVAGHRHAGEPGREPVLEREPADLPELPADRVALDRGKVPPPAGPRERRLDVRLDERPAHAIEPRLGMPVHDVDPLGAGLADQRRPLVRALAPADDQHPRPVHAREVDEVARVLAEPGAPLGDDAEARDARRRDDGAGGDRLPARERGGEAALQPDHLLLAYGDARLAREPVRVLEEARDRQRIRLVACQELAQRELLGGIEMPFGAGSQVHAGRHVLAPEAHRTADDRRRQPGPQRLARDGKPIRPGADDEQIGQTRISTASPCPPPPHSVATPSPPPRRRSSNASVRTSRRPDAASGCPSATAPPLTFTRSRSIPSAAADASTTPANASLISHRSTSPGATPYAESSFADASAGRRCSVESAPAPTARPTPSAKGEAPRSRVVPSPATPPSDPCDALPAVIVPSRVNAAGSAANASYEDSRAPSSTANEPTGAISSASRERPSSARACERAAKRSCASREIPSRAFSASDIAPMPASAIEQ